MESDNCTVGIIFVVRWLVTVTLSQEDKLRMAFGIGVKKSPMKILMVLLLLAAVAMTVVTVIWFLFVRL